MLFSLIFLASPCSREIHICMQCSQLYFKLKEISTIAFCLASNLLVVSRISDMKSVCISKYSFFKSFWFLSVAFLVHPVIQLQKCKYILQASVPGQTAFLETFWLKGSAETYPLRVEVPCFQNSTIIMIYPNQFWDDKL